MYSFILVDDEPEIREGIRDNIPWEELGFRFAGAYSNGSEALEAAEKEAPDALMTDINMPFMDGLSLCERLRESAPDTKVLILTGYDDFDYARKALQLQVQDFILKPLTPGEFKRTLESLRRRLDEERGAKRDQRRLERQLAESLPLLRERCLNRILASPASAEDARERFESFKLDIPVQGASYLAVVLDYARPAGGKASDLELLAERNLITETVPENYRAEVFQDPNDRVVLLAWGPKGDQLYRESLKVAETLRGRLAKARFDAAAIGVGECVDSLDQVGVSYQDALRALGFARISGGKSVVAYREILGKSGRERRPSQAWGKLIGAALKTGTLEAALRHVDEMVDSFRRATFEPDAYYRSLRMTLASVLQILDDLEIPESGIFPDGEDPFSEVRELEDLEACRAWFAALSRRIVSFLGNRQENFARAKAREAVDYLEERYGDPDLSVASLCKDLYISTSYFSLIFKKFHERTLVEYLTDLRMRKAQELLRTTNLKTYEVAARVGYRDAHYFSLSFRKAAGTTPTAYRNREDDEED